MKIIDSRNTSGTNFEELTNMTLNGGLSTISGGTNEPAISATIVGNISQAVMKPLKKPNFSELRNRLKSEKLAR